MKTSCQFRKSSIKTTNRITRVVSENLKGGPKKIRGENTTTSSRKRIKKKVDDQPAPNSARL